MFLVYALLLVCSSNGPGQRWSRDVCAFGLDEVCAFGLDKFLNWLIWRHRLSESVYKSNIFSKAVCRLNKGF